MELADDNVHFQNATQMVTALVKANIHFDSFYYPNKNHGIGGGPDNTTFHLWSMKNKLDSEKPWKRKHKKGLKKEPPMKIGGP